STSAPSARACTASRPGSPPTAASAPGSSPTRCISGVAERKQLVLVAMTAGGALASIDMTVVSVMLPTVEADLGASAPATHWIVAAYFLTLGAVVAVGGRLGDLFGHERLFIGG